MEWNAKWIKPAAELGAVVPVFSTNFSLKSNIKEAKLFITALGTYEARINGQRVGDFILAPGFTSYSKRLQYQEYDVTNLLQESNFITVLVGKGWYRSRLMGSDHPVNQARMAEPAGLLAQLLVVYEDGSQDIIASDENWNASESAIRFSEIYDGEIEDATFQPDYAGKAVAFDGPSHTLIPQEGEDVIEQERVSVARIFTTPKGETVIDFGQEVTGYVETTVSAKASEIVDLSFAEVMDKEGNFYTENYRGAKAQYHYTCRDGVQTYKPKLTFWGFRYIRVNQFPGGTDKVTKDSFTAIALHSNMKRTGYLSCSNPLLNKLFSNIIWGQKDNFVDIPTDCPQRDERAGWTGDAQVFSRTACYNFDT